MAIDPLRSKDWVDRFEETSHRVFAHHRLHAEQLRDRSRRAYPNKLRRIRDYDAESKLILVLLTNNFTLPALTVAAIYKRRREIDLFSRWIKQHLRLHGFFATTPNGVAIQIWTALCAYRLVAITKQRLGLSGSLHQILQVI